MSAKTETPPEIIAPTRGVEDMAELFAFLGNRGGRGPLAPPRAEVVSTEETPEPFRSLLSHHGHMTETLERHIGAPVNVHPLDVVHRDERASGGRDRYARRISLSDSRTGRVVMYGIMRIDLSVCEPEVRRAILEGRTPLGRILVEHDVMREVNTHALLRIQPDAAMLEAFGEHGPEEVYGRLATIFWDGEPAVDLLEIVGPGCFHAGFGGGRAD